MKYIRDPKKIREMIIEHELDRYFTDIERYMDYFRIFTASKKEILFGEAEKRQEIYLMLEGRVKVCTILNNGRQLTLNYHDDFDIFGDFILTDDPAESINHFLSEAVTPIMGLALHVTPVKELLQNDVRFLQLQINSLQSRFRQLGNVQPMNVLNSSERNLAGLIWSRMPTDKNRANQPYYFKENLRELAEQMGISYRHLHRVLHKFVDEGILERTEKGYLVTDVRALQEIVEFE